jgi:replicative DNA helicase Mcm
MIITKRKHDRSLIGQFTEFLSDYYRDEIAEAIQNGDKSVTVDYSDLYQYSHDLALDTVEQPEIVYPELDRGLTDVEIPVPGAEESLKDMKVRLSGVDEVDLTVNALRTDYRNQYLGLRGQVSRASQVQPRTVQAVFRCEHCSTPESDMTVGPIPQYTDEIEMPNQCPSCERSGPFTLLDDHKNTQMVDHQKIELTDEPGENMGANSHSVPVHIYRDETGRIMPGDRIRVNGLITTDEARSNSSTKKINTSRPWRVEGRAIDPEEVAFAEVEPERVDEIKKVAESDTLVDDVIQSVAPHIVSDERGRMHKLAIALQWFGGVKRDNRRGDINVFLVGSKGTGKSQLLRRGANLAPKSVEASGKGATAAGLTATATQSEHGGWMLDAGALVLASGGMASIDEFDKMNSGARKSMHEAMEDQRVPINKAGINTVLPTETAILAAANPNGGEFDRFTPLTKQVDLEAPLLSRFDLVFGLMDSADKDWDENIARAQYDSTQDEPVISDELLTEYIAYARQNYDPEIPDGEVKDKLVNFYVENRQQHKDSDGLNIGPRTNDDLRRLSEASARMRLSDTVEMQDAERAIELKKMHFGDVMLNREGELDAAQGEGYSSPDTQEERKERLKDALERADEPLTPAEISERTPLSEDKVHDELDTLSKKGLVIQPQTGEYRLT